MILIYIGIGHTKIYILEVLNIGPIVNYFWRENTYFKLPNAHNMVF